MWNYEVSVQISSETVSLELTAFMADSSNLIRTEGRYPNLVYGNSGGFVHRGVEFSAVVGVLEPFTLETTYGYLDAGEQTMANPRHKLFVEGQYRERWWSINAGVQYISGLYGADRSTKAITDYALFQARLTVTRWGARLTLPVRTSRCIVSDDVGLPDAGAND
jgi:outer membrane cobalamin receptor